MYGDGDMFENYTKKTWHIIFAINAIFWLKCTFYVVQNGNTVLSWQFYVRKSVS